MRNAAVDGVYVPFPLVRIPIANRAPLVLANYCKTRFANWGDEVHGEGATRTWSGLMTDSKDALPLVGEVPGKDGMFLSAGFHGHGQVSILFPHLDQGGCALMRGAVEDLYRRAGTRGDTQDRTMGVAVACFVPVDDGEAGEESTCRDCVG